MRLLKFSNRFTAYTIHPIELNLGRMILNNLLSYEQDFLGTGEMLYISMFLPTSFLHVLLSRRRRYLYLLDLRDDRRWALFFDLLRYYVADKIKNSQNDTRHWCAQSRPFGAIF